MKTLSDAENDLIEAKFVHVTGLVCKNALLVRVALIRPQRSDYGRWSNDQGSLVLVTEEGRVFVGFALDIDEVLPVINRACPKGKGVSLCCVDEIPSQMLLMRLRDPFGDMYGFYPSEEQ